MKYKNLTLRDVAKSAGVSVSTVSRVLNKEKFTSDDVKTRVNNAIKKLKYTPDLNARNLRLGKTNVIGIVIPNISDYFFSRVVYAITKFFRENGKDIILFNTSNEEELEEKEIRLALSKRVEGIILATISKNVSPISTLINNFGIPFVIIDNKIKVKNVDFVLSDDENRANKLISHLINVHNLKKIACISGPLDESSGFNKLSGYKIALENNNISINEEYIKIANWKKDLAYACTKELINMNNRPEAIYCANSNMLIGCLRYLNTTKIKIPEDLAIVTFDDYDFISAMNPPITSLKSIVNEMGILSAKLLLDRINGKKEDYKEIKLDSDLMIRRSCGCNLQ
ncbi:LacI family transcriptional regulator [bacterium]|nr:LacI family transcriptional regulator [bacterium]